jgi:hypothetical protein
MHRCASAPLIALALLAAACGGGVADPEATETTAREAPPDTEAGGVPADDTHYRWEVGDCVLVESRDDLPYEPYGRTPLVACDEPHTYEVFDTGQFDEPEDHPYPEDLNDRAWEACAAAFEDFVGVHMAESGLEVIVYLPDRAEWGRGLRYRACVVHDPSPGGDLPTATGSLKGIGDAVPFAAEVGDCYVTGSIRGPGVECSNPHRAEIIGFLTHGEGEGSYPGREALRAEAAAGCDGLLAGYATPGAALVPTSPVSFARLLTEAEWSGGIRTVPCTALVFDGDRRHLMVVGSLSEPDWWVIGAEQSA